MVGKVNRKDKLKLAEVDSSPKDSRKANGEKEFLKVIQPVVILDLDKQPSNSYRKVF